MSNRHSRNWSVILSIGRIIGIVIGIAALLQLATDTGMVEYNALFQEWMDRLRGISPVAWLSDLIEVWGLLPMLSLLRGIWPNIPSLQPHWEPIWLLTGLAIAPASQHILGDLDKTNNFVIFVFGLFCALSSAILASFIDINQSDKLLATAAATVFGPLLFIFTISSFKDFSQNSCKFSDSFSTNLFRITIVRLCTLSAIFIIAMDIYDWAYDWNENTYFWVERLNLPHTREEIMSQGREIPQYMIFVSIIFALASSLFLPFFYQYDEKIGADIIFTKESLIAVDFLVIILLTMGIAYFFSV